MTKVSSTPRLGGGRGADHGPRETSAAGETYLQGSGVKSGALWEDDDDESDDGMEAAKDAALGDT